MRPTALGEHAIARARLVLSELDGFIGDLARGARSPSAAINMGVAHMECVGTMLSRIRQVIPGIVVNLLVEPSAVTLTQSLAHRRLDIALVGMMDDYPVPLAASLAQRTFITRLPVFVAMADTHHLATQPSVALADLAHEHWICPPGPDDGSLASLRQACRQAGFEPSIRYQAPSGGGRALITSGQAVQLVEPTSKPIGGLTTRPLVGEPLKMRLILAWQRDRITAEEAGRHLHRDRAGLLRTRHHQPDLRALVGSASRGASLRPLKPFCGYRVGLRESLLCSPCPGMTWMPGCGACRAQGRGAHAHRPLPLRRRTRQRHHRCCRSPARGWRRAPG